VLSAEDATDASVPATQHSALSTQHSSQHSSQLFVLEVADTGVGIPPEDRERVFERFYTVNRSRGGADRGTGLGLAIVKHAVMAMGGSVELSSDVGRGTTVRCLFPLEDTPADLPQSPTPEPVA
jgi:signal transduction histidine kinase